MREARAPKACSKNCASACSVSLTTVKRGPRLRRKPCVEIVKGEKCVGRVIIGFPGGGFCTVLEALPSDEVEDSSSDTPVRLAVDYGGDLPLLFVVNDNRWWEVCCCPGYTSVTAGSKRET